MSDTEIAAWREAGLMVARANVLGENPQECVVIPRSAYDAILAALDPWRTEMAALDAERRESQAENETVFPNRFPTETP